MSDNNATISGSAAVFVSWVALCLLIGIALWMVLLLVRAVANQHRFTAQDTLSSTPVFHTRIIPLQAQDQEQERCARENLLLSDTKTPLHAPSHDNNDSNASTQTTRAETQAAAGGAGPSPNPSQTTRPRPATVPDHPCSLKIEVDNV